MRGRGGAGDGGLAAGNGAGPGARAAAGRVAMATEALAQLRVRRPGRHFGACQGVLSAGVLPCPPRTAGPEPYRCGVTGAEGRG